MSTEYHQVLRSELAGTAAKWLAVLKLAVTVSGYFSALYLRSQGAPTWQVVGAAAASVILTFVLLYLSGRSAWMKEHAARAQAETEMEGIKNSSPRLIPKEPGAVHIEPIAFTNRENGQVVWDAYFLKIRLVNDPPRPSPTSEAERVLAKIAYSRDGHLIREVDGRWSESEQPLRRIMNLQTITDLLHMDFGIGAERSVDLVFKKDEDQDAYIFNNDNYLAQPEMKKPEHRLEPGNYEVRIRLRATRVEEVFKFCFVNPGAGKRLEITKNVER